MPHSATPRSDRFSHLVIGLLASGALAMLALTGCTSNPVVPRATTPATSSASPEAPAPAPASPAATDAPEASPTAAPSPTQTPSGTPVGLGCDDVLSPDDIYAFNPNFGTAPDFEPTGLVASAPSYGGVACGWLNQSSGTILEVSVAKPDEQSTEDLKNKAVMAGKAVPTYGTPPEVEAYFSKSGETGTVQVFTGGYWVVASSEAFYEPGDAQKLITMIQDNLA